MDKTVNFSFRDSDSQGTENMGTKYNDNINGKLIGLYNYNEKQYLITEVQTSFNNSSNDMLDVREVKVENSYTLYCSNEPDETSQKIASILNSEETLEAIHNGTKLEETKGFKQLQDELIYLIKDGMELHDLISVCGQDKKQIEPETQKTIK